MGRKEREGGLIFSTNKELMNQWQEEVVVETLSPDRQLLVVRRDTKARKGKVVTLITGFVGSEEALNALAKRLKTACGVGGSAKEMEIIIQGEQVDKVVALLCSWGYTRTRMR